MSAAAAAARGLVKRYGAFTAVDGIEFSIARRECFGFLGPNGAGKTTTMRMLSCLSERDGGDLEVLGLDPGHSPRTVKRRLGVVPQEINLDLELTVRENLLVYARYFDIPRREAEARAEELLRFVELFERAEGPVERLSGGMKRRLQIARALINEPELVLLDEPTTGLDPQARRLVWERLRDLTRRGVTLILTTHYMEEAAQLCDRLVLMDHGRIVREGPPARLVADELGREVLELRVPAGDRAELLGRIGGDALGHQAHGELLTLHTDDAEELFARARATGLPVELQVARPATLEDLFLAVTGHGLGEDEAVAG
ncbi:MAG TPA: ABC transporter ATP-binding protein [Miltoncostaeaceae bacterium]|nr:ABC transporter ATP-binding protein [Miltoncostaeaceae bacterium]